MANIPLVDDLFVLRSLSMKLKDLEDFEVVLALYTISHCAEGMLDEIDKDDLPEMLRDDYRSVRSSICALTKSIEQYRDDHIATFISACED